MNCQSLPPGPDMPAWEQAKAWIENPIEFWTECRAKFGDPFTIQFGSLGPTVLFCSPEAVRQVFALPVGSYECQSYNAHYRLIMGSRSILTIDGEDHREQRRVLSPVLMPVNTRHWLASFRAYARTKFEALVTQETVHVRRLVHEIVFHNMLQLLFRDQQPGIKNLLEKLFLDYMVEDYGTWSPWTRFVKSQAALRTLLDSEIRRLRNASPAAKGKEYEDLFTHLVNCHTTQGKALSEEQIQDHIFTMLIAGVDPTSISATWALYWIHKTPRVLSRLRDEFYSVHDLDEYLSREDHYLQATCQESLRMYPVVTTPSGRKLLTPREIGGTSYPAETTLLPCTYLAHRRAEVFPEPDEFQPERFLGRSYSNAEYFPFGGGRRVCIGAKMALLTLKAILYDLLSNVEFTPVTEGDVQPIRHGTLLAPSDNFRLRIVRHTSPQHNRGY